MSYASIVQALANLEGTGLPLKGPKASKPMGCNSTKVLYLNRFSINSGTVMMSNNLMLENSSTPISTIAQVLAESFSDDPSFNLVFDQNPNRLSAMYAFFEPFVADASKRGKIIMAPNSQGACIWYPAEVEIFNEQFEQVLMEIIKNITKFAGEESAQRFQHLIEQIGNNEPQQSHCEVFFIGLKPSARGKGIGQNLLKPVLDYADKNQHPCYLVSSSSRNISFYERHGFEKYCPIKISDTYSMTGMWRDFISN